MHVRQVTVNVITLCVPGKHTGIVYVYRCFFHVRVTNCQCRIVCIHTGIYSVCVDPFTFEKHCVVVSLAVVSLEWCS